MRAALFATISVLLGTAVGLTLLEVPLRFLPVSEGLMTEPVNDSSSVFRFTPNRNVVWSRGWDFAIVNRLRVNNAGYVNDQDYSADDARPLLAVVGDSYVEARWCLIRRPFKDGLHRLPRRTRGSTASARRARR